ncbi:uncharacterized protein FIESC28_07120 [Fusarium coffeatum]|uniref:Uncharacterized protein n=1 Tax=Fusarium coffeatum TaxID=231269 RepID=A0A366RHB3_9HYPO|nr:uncharacterized protein FIESC28_07120 [Fusarium coffeatum]RBR15918.1 hypothetical protein FIESC28_07120 [Fusarium coffeatum]
MQDKRADSWPFPISINAAIAILSTACTAAMMYNVSAFIGQLKWSYLKARPRQLDSVQVFDGASRGPYGAIVFLFKISWNMATLGAVITILRLGFSPMVQEVISLESRQIPVQDGNATFGFAHSYNRSMYPGEFGGIPPDPQMQSAIIKGLYDIHAAPVFSCAGACFWKGSYVSLGFKSVCKNVTVSTLKTRFCTDSTGGSISFSDIPDDERAKCNMTTPGGIVLSAQHKLLSLLTMFRSNTTATHSGLGASPDLMRIAVYRSSRDNAYMPLNIDITECTISYTAYEYTNATANGSVFSFGKTKTIDLEWAAIIFGKDVRLDDSQGQPWQNARRLSSADPKDDLPELYSWWNDDLALTEFFQSEIFQLEYIEGIYGNFEHSLSTLLSGQTNLSRAFDNMATSMTDYIRSGPNMKLAKGSRLDTEIFVSVRWYWLIGPGLIELASLLFAVATIVSNGRKHKVPLWKSSALVLLACQHDEDEGLIRGTTKSMVEIEKKAKNLKVRLE